MYFFPVLEHCPFLDECSLTKVKATNSYQCAKEEQWNITGKMKSACLNPGIVMCKLTMSKLFLIFQSKYKSKTSESLSYHVETGPQCQISAHSTVFHFKSRKFVLWKICQKKILPIIIKTFFLLLYRTALYCAGGYLSDFWDGTFFITNTLMNIERQ